jgi:hypothetical protein
MLQLVKIRTMTPTNNRCMSHQRNNPCEYFYGDISIRGGQSGRTSPLPWGCIHCPSITNNSIFICQMIIQGLPYIKMTTFTDDEFATLPHVILTSNMPWRHNVFDCTLSDKNDWYQNTTNWSEGMIQSPFKLDGTYKHLRDPLEPMSMISS